MASVGFICVLVKITSSEHWGHPCKFRSMSRSTNVKRMWSGPPFSKLTCMQHKYHISTQDNAQKHANITPTLPAKSTSLYLFGYFKCTTWIPSRLSNAITLLISLLLQTYVSDFLHWFHVFRFSVLYIKHLPSLNHFHSALPRTWWDIGQVG